MSAVPPVPEAIVRQAIGWQMRLRATSPDADLHAQVRDWLQRDERHRLAWQRLQEMDGFFQAARLPEAGQAIPVLQRAEADVSRRRALKMLGLTLAGGGSLVLATKMPPAWHADFATATGERRHLEAVRGVDVQLNTGSALDVEDGTLVLRAGEMLVEGADWRARCRFARCEGQDARMLMRERDGRSEIRVARGAVRLTTSFEQRWLGPGEGVAVSALGIAPLVHDGIDPFAWTRGLLVVSDIRLSKFLAEAGRYRRGWLACDQAVANLRLSGVFRLDEPEDMLRNLTHLLPVRLVERTRWWVRVAPLA